MLKYFLLLILSSLYLPVFADGYWLEISGSHTPHTPVTIKVRYGGVSDSGARYIKSGKVLDKMSGFTVSVTDASGNRTPVRLEQQNDCWQGSFTPSADGNYQILGIDESLPVVDRSAEGGVSVKPVQYLCSLYQVGKATNTFHPQQFLDLLTTRTDSSIHLQAFINQTPAAQAKLRIFPPDNHDILPVTDEAGKASFTPVLKGLYIIRLDWTDKKSGDNNGVHYEAIRHRCDFTLTVE